MQKPDGVDTPRADYLFAGQTNRQADRGMPNSL